MATIRTRVQKKVTIHIGEEEVKKIILDHFIRKKYDVKEVYINHSDDVEITIDDFDKTENEDMEIV